MKLHIVAVLCVLGVLAFAPAALAQPWTISKVVDEATPCSATALFNPYNASYSAIDGPWVIFIDAGFDNCTSNNGQSLWSYNLITNSFVKLADTTTPVPPTGAYEFEGFVQNVFDNLQVRNGTVLFFGFDAGHNTTTNCQGGLYTVPAGGGTITRVVDYTMTLPGHGGSFCGTNNSYGINGVMGMSLDDGKVVFSAETNTANDGVWWAPPNVNTTEGDLHRIADAGTVYYTPFPPGCVKPDCADIYQWGSAFIEGSTIAFTGGGYPTGLFVNSNSNAVLLSNYILPGDNSPNPNEPDYSSYFYGPVVDGSNVFFLAFDPNYTGTCANGGSGTGYFYGVFETTTKGKTATNIMNTCETQPNGDPIGLNSFFQMAANEGTVVFEVEDETLGFALDSSINGVVSTLLQPGGPLPTGASCDGTPGSPGCATQVGRVGTGAMSGGRVVFFAEGGPSYGDFGIYVASLPCSTAASNVTVTLGALSYNATTGIWTQSATVKNTSKTAITGPLALVLANLTAGATLTNPNGSTVCFAPAGSPYINLPLSGNELKGKAGVTVSLKFSAPADAEITFTSEVASPGAR